ncbi:MAG: Gfo/Idh/MocA family oxidoreductase [Chloroflexota bacterium]|nr:Gfo/Idh/MocA family oxidoreductase [Chloroflexota bacterium]
MAEKVRIGIIGTSYWVDEFHLPILQNHPNALVQALCGRNQTNTEELARKFGVEKTFTDYRQMLDDGNLDAVIICTPEDQHHPMTMAALDKGLHVLCEKPMAFTADEAFEMLSKAKEKKVKHMVNFTMRWIPHFQFLKHLMDNNYIGKPYHAHFHWLSGWHPDREDYTWYYDPKHSHGAASELGVHMIDQARWYLGEIRSVQASIHSFVKRSAADRKEMEASASDSAIYLLEFESGAHSTIHVSTVNRVSNELIRSGQFISLHGQDGTLESRAGLWSSNPISEIEGLKRGTEKAETLQVPDSYFGSDGRENLFGFNDKPILGPRLFVDAILNDQSLQPNFYDGYKAQQVIQAALESDKTGKITILIE